MPWRNLIPWKRWGGKRPAVADAHDRPMLALQRDMNRVFEDFRRRSFWTVPFEPFGEDVGTFEIPKVDVEEGQKAIKVTAEVPGLSEQDVQLTLSPAGDVLHLRGERKHENTQEDQDKGWYRYERHHGVLQRSIDLPCSVKTDGAEATLKDGVLRVRLERRDRAPQAKRITVTSR